MTDSTPLNADKELREELYRLLNTDPRGDTYVIPYRVMDIIVDFITADRKRIALEARIDEMDVALAEVTHWSIDDADSAIHGYGEYRIDKLRQEIERIESDE